MLSRLSWESLWYRCSSASVADVRARLIKTSYYRGEFRTRRLAACIDRTYRISLWSSTSVKQTFRVEAGGNSHVGVLGALRKRRNGELRFHQRSAGGNKMEITTSTRGTQKPVTISYQWDCCSSPKSCARSRSSAPSFLIYKKLAPPVSWTQYVVNDPHSVSPPAGEEYSRPIQVPGEHTVL